MTTSYSSQQFFRRPEHRVSGISPKPTLTNDRHSVNSGAVSEDYRFCSRFNERDPPGDTAPAAAPTFNIRAPAIPLFHLIGRDWLRRRPAEIGPLSKAPVQNDSRADIFAIRLKGPGIRCAPTTKARSWGGWGDFAESALTPGAGSSHEACQHTPPPGTVEGCALFVKYPVSLFSGSSESFGIMVTRQTLCTLQIRGCLHGLNDPPSDRFISPLRPNDK